MMIVGHGIDLVDLARIDDLPARDRDSLDGWFTAREIVDLLGRAFRPDVVAERIAAKEAVVKALGAGFVDEVSWQDIEITVSERGALLVVLSGGAANVAQASEIEQILVSVSHSTTVAV